MNKFRLRIINHEKKMLREYFGRMPESSGEREQYLEQLETLMASAAGKQAEVALAMEGDRNTISGEDFEKCNRQWQAINKYLNTNRQSLNLPQLIVAVKEMENVDNNLDRIIKSFNSDANKQ